MSYDGLQTAEEEGFPGTGGKNSVSMAEIERHHEALPCLLHNGEAEEVFKKSEVKVSECRNLIEYQ